MKVALVKPQLAGHKMRGTGVYTDCLYHELRKQNNISVSLVKTGESFDNFDIVHFPYFDPFFLTLPIVKKKPTVVTIHDLIPLSFPKFFPRGVRGKLKWVLQKLSTRNVSAVITDSKASKKDIINYLKINRKKIQVIYLGVREEFRQIQSEKRLSATKLKLSLPSDFILNVGDVNYNKNILGIIKAFKQIIEKFPNLKLVFVGQGFIDNSPQLEEIKKLLNKLNLEKKVIRLGHIKLDNLVGLYNLAKVYLQPSFAEGFGLPVAEAMACGTPVVASNISCLLEVTGSAALLVDAGNPNQIAKGVIDLLQDEDKYKDLVQKGLARAKQFTWEKCARETMRIYERVLRN